VKVVGAAASTGIGALGLRCRLAAAGVPVLLRAGGPGFDVEGAQLRPLAQAPLELGEAGEAGQPGDVVPEPDGVLRAGQPADDRAEERRFPAG
jgi:hypothetical protein